MINNKDLSIPAQPRGFQFRRGLATFLMLCGLCGLTCQSDDICRGVDGACLAIDVDAELEPLPLPGVTLEAVLTTSGNQEQVGDPDVSVVPLTALPLRWRITKLPGSVTPSQISKLEILARLPAGSGGGAGEIIASSIVEPLSWSDGSRQRIAVKLAPVAKPEPFESPRVPTSGGGVAAFVGTRLCYPGHTRITVGGLEATITRCTQAAVEVNTPAASYQQTGYEIRVQTGSGRSVFVGRLLYYPSHLDFSTIQGYPLADAALLDVGISMPLLYYTGQKDNMQKKLAGYRNGIAVGDFDGNGCPDIAVPNYLRRTVQILWGIPISANGSSVAQCSPSAQLKSISLPMELNRDPPVFYPFAVTVQDLDDDGIDDLYVASYKNETAILQDGQGILAFYGARDQASFGMRWQRVSTQAQIAPYLLVAGRVIPNDATATHKQIIAVDGATAGGWQQRDQVTTCFGLNYADKPQDGSPVDCTSSPTVPLETVREILISPENGNGIISSLTPILTRLSSDGKEYIDALIVTSYGNKQVSIVTNKRLPRNDVAYPAGAMFQGDFAKTDDFMDNLAGSPVAAAFADIDGDRKRDLIVIEESGNKVYLYKNTTSDGKYKLTVSQRILIRINTPEDATRELTDIKAVDINNDGEDDVIITSGNNIMFFLSEKSKDKYAFHSYENHPGNGPRIQPDFQIASNQNQGFSFSSVVHVADIDKDGVKDIIVLNRQSSVLNVAYGFIDSSAKQYRAYFPSYFYGSQTYQSQIANAIAYAEIPNKLTPEKIEQVLLMTPNYGGGQYEIYEVGASKPCCGSLPKSEINIKDDKVKSVLKIDIASNINPRSLVVSDFNRDGRPDCASVVYHNIPAGHTGFVIWDCINQQALSYVPVNNGPAGPDQSVSLADIDGDQFQELLFLELRNAIKLVKNDHQNSGAFLPSKSVKLASGNDLPIQLAITKQGNSGRTGELIVASDSSVYVYVNSGVDPFFSSDNPQTVELRHGVMPLRAARALAAGQLRNTGKDDVVIVHIPTMNIDQCVSGVGCISIFDPREPNSTETMTIPVPYDPGAQAQIAIADVDLNGINDILLLSRSRSLISIFLGQIDSSESAKNRKKWELYKHISAGSDATSLSIVDYDRDGLPDIATSNFQIFSATVIKNISR